MKVYLAARYSERERLREYAAFIKAMGHVITSRWLSTNWTARDANDSANVPPAQRAEWAQKDLQDVLDAEMIISFTDGERGSRGGRHVEFGIGLAAGKIMIVIGPKEHLFHDHPSVNQYATMEDFLTKNKALMK